MGYTTMKKRFYLKYVQSCRVMWCKTVHVSTNLQEVLYSSSYASVLTNLP